MEKWQNLHDMPWKSGRFALYLSWKSGDRMVTVSIIE